MRACILFGSLIFGAASIVAVTPNLTQGQGKKGGFGGPGGGAAAMMNQDPGTIFDQLSKSRGFFLITETRSLRDPLMQFAQEKGISNGQINRNQYLEFHAQYKRTLEASGGGASPFGPPGGNPFGPPGGNPFGKGMGKKGFGGDGMGMMAPAGPPQTPDMINAQADALFQKLDKNGDGKLNQDEMPGRLKGSLTRFDKNGDGLIDLNEFRDYFLAQMTGDTDPIGGRNQNQIVIDEDELDRVPVVLRAGKLPSNMPDWFKKYDLDGDGQVALFEWRKVNEKSLEDFKEWDLNDDGFITPEEALKHQALLTKDNPKTGRGPGSMAFNRDSMDPNSDRKAAFSKKNNKGGDSGGTPPWGEKGKKKKGGGGQ